MSRVSDALTRARDGNAPSQSDLPAPDVFHDSWAVADSSRIAEAPAPATPVGRESAPEACNSVRSLSTPVDVSPVFPPALAEKLVVTPQARSALVEQYRKLAGALHHAQLERGMRVVMVTSAVAAEGKTLTATNLALTMSGSYRRSVLLVDADLRCPRLHNVFGTPNLAGLGDGLRASGQERLSLTQLSPTLSLLTAGRPDPDPMSGLTSDRMRAVIGEAAARFDWVMVDTPPVALLPDAGLLARIVDSVLLVVRAGATPYPLVQRAVAAIGRERIFGVVLNSADDDIAFGHQYYSYYDHYGRESES